LFGNEKREKELNRVRVSLLGRGATFGTEELLLAQEVRACDAKCVSISANLLWLRE
jgi:hypothetical protein